MDPITQFIFAAAAGAIGAELEVNFLVVGGGGGGGNSGPQSGGGAGGFITSWNPNNYSHIYSGAQSQTLSPVILSENASYNVSVGAGGGYGQNNGSDSSFGGTDKAGNTFNHQAEGGGYGGGNGFGGSSGGSGGGGGLIGNIYQSPGQGTANQGNRGYGLTGMGPINNNYLCSLYGGNSYWCQPTWVSGGGGGGSASIGSLQNGGDATYSDIIGTNTAYAAGGVAEGTYGNNAGNPPGGYQTGNSGGGGRGGQSGGADGVVILRFPSSFSYSTSGLTVAQTLTIGTDTVLEFTQGAGNITFS